MSCILRIGGIDLDPDALLAASGLVAYRIDRKGEVGRRKSRGPNTKSSVHIDVSSADFNNLGGQIKNAMDFLHTNRAQLQIANAFPGVEWATLDFAVDHADAVDCKYFNPEFLAVAGNLGVGIEISIYPQAVPPAER